MKALIITLALATSSCATGSYVIDSAINPGTMKDNIQWAARGKVYLHRCIDQTVLFTYYDNEHRPISQSPVTYRTCVIGNAEMPNNDTDKNLSIH